ncbi:MAG: D-alanine--D-alanine ligase [Treponema sp.]|nr:D-alanine--D-alanine ligase [Treponema sp.]
MNVVLLYGGRSGEHEISIISCTSVARNISDKHNVHLISIDKDGKWYLEDDSLFEEIKKNKDAKLSIHPDDAKRVSIIPGGGKDGALVCGGKAIPCDVAFPVLHGTYGEDGTIQGLFEMADIPFVGCGVLSSSSTMDKDTTKILWKNAGLPVVPSICITRADVNDSKRYDEKIKKAIDTLHFPLFVKPCAAGSSDGASKAENEKELSYALMEAFEWDNKVLIEKAIPAREVECSVMGNSITFDSANEDTLIKSYGPGEIVPRHTFYDYDAKYNDPDGADLVIPAKLDQDKLSYIKETAKKAYMAVGASGLSRVDFFIDRETGDIYLNEINTMPGFTSISMFPKLCGSEGIDFTSLTEILFNEATAQYQASQKLRTSRTN